MTANDALSYAMDLCDMEMSRAFCTELKLDALDARKALSTLRERLNRQTPQPPTFEEWYAAHGDSLIGRPLAQQLYDSIAPPAP